MSLSDWRLKEFKNCKEFPKYLYYLSSKENFQSILTNGILSKNEIQNKKISYKSFAEEDVQKRRSEIQINISDGLTRCSLHELVPLYFNPKSPTLYSRQAYQNDYFFCKISPIKIISDLKKKFAFTDGNAASDNTKQFWNLKKLQILKWNIINSEFWNDFEDGKRIRNAEFLIHQKIEIKYISEFVVNNNDLKNTFEIELNKKSIKIPVKVDKFCFFN